ncbi:MAG: hypothetical protein N4A62_15370 [Marinisporobacter sp.]|jgi:hypothetical protein|nr:hypothetical protein [Marinisporobacter sp.]
MNTILGYLKTLLRISNNYSIIKEGGIYMDTKIWYSLDKLIPIIAGILALVVPNEFWREYKMVKGDEKKVKSFILKKRAISIIIILGGLLFLLKK